MDEVAESLFVGTVDDAGDDQQLRENDIETIVSLTHRDPDHGFPDSVEVVNAAMMDGPRNDKHVFESAFEAVLSGLASDETVLVHCSRGASRSPAVAATAIAVYYGIGIHEAFEQVKQRRDNCNPHDALVHHAVTVYKKWES